MLKNTSNTFGAITKCIHWLLFVLLVIQFTLGTLYALATQNSPQQSQFITWHKSVGLTILFVGLLFMIWKHMNIRPQPANVDPAWKHLVAKIVQHTMLLLVLITPILGYGLSCASGYAVDYFAWFTLPCLFEKNEQWALILDKSHILLGLTLLSLIMLHMLAALHHHFIVKDNVLKRMLPFIKVK